MPTERRRPGRPAHQPTAETRDLVATLVGRGKSANDIALAIGISEPTLRAHYAAELIAARPQISFPLPDFDQPAPPRAAPARAGRPEHVPTAETRERVEILVAGGMRVWQIADALDISEPTLRQHYDRELGKGRARKDAAVLEALFRAATEAGNVAAQKAWLARPAELDDPPPTAPKEAPIGKKAAAAEAAVTAAEGTPWGGILPN